jgi:predicted metal-binding membrane protein
MAMNDRSLAFSAALRIAPIWIGLTVIVALSWLYLAHMSAGMAGMSSTMNSTMKMGSVMTHHAMPMQRALPLELLFTFVMWSVMMVAMMVPTAVPAIALFSTVSGRRNPSQNPAIATAIYAGGYLAAWVGYSVFAALAQWALTRTMLISPMAGSSSAAVSALILLSAGLYQFTSLKSACLTQCRSPLAFFMAEWRDGNRGAFVLGLRQGAYCVTCCWTLMAVMFVVGVMNLAWMVFLAVFMLAEKVTPPTWYISRVSGVILIVWGVWIGAGIWL